MALSARFQRIHKAVNIQHLRTPLANQHSTSTWSRSTRPRSELEEVARYFGGYIWSCVRCGHRTKSKESYFLEAERAERISKSVIQEKLWKAG